MREEVLDYIKGLNLGSYSTSEDLPRDESGTPLYIKNPKRIYVEADSYNEVPLIVTFSGNGITSYTTSVSVIFSSDAKRLPNNYDELVGQLIGAKNIQTEEGYNSREAVVTTGTEADLLITQIEYSYTKIR